MKTSIQKIVNAIDHRPWPLPNGKWKYYQEWNNAVFLHWRADHDLLREFVPTELELDSFNHEYWISIVAFTMEKIRPRNLPYFPPVSNFHEINLRTYVKYRGKPGVYFLSIEGGTRASCNVAKGLSELPYRYSRIKRQQNFYFSRNEAQQDQLEVEYKVGKPISLKSELDKFLMEKYALFQDTENAINEFDIHHLEWPSSEIETTHLKVKYPRFERLINNTPDRMHYSSGVQVLAWGKKKNEKSGISKRNNMLCV